jgi:hypothetical protein
LKKVLVGVVLGALGWQAYSQYSSPTAELEPTSEPEYLSDSVDASDDEEPETSSDFTCDGRKYCSEMTSCEEAIFFLENCPGVKMDGGRNGSDGQGDGVPCERQWCN